MENFYKPGVPLEKSKPIGDERTSVPGVSRERDDEEAVSSFVQEVPSDEDRYDLDEALEIIKKNAPPRKVEFLFGEPEGGQK